MTINTKKVIKYWLATAEHKIDLSLEQIDALTTITGFNIAARYNEVKFDFYKRCTKMYTEKYFLISKKLYLWLKKLSQKK